MRLPRAGVPTLGLLLSIFPISSIGFAQTLVPSFGRWVTPAQAAADSARPVVAPRPAWGTTGTTAYSLGACDATNREPDHPFTAINCDSVSTITGPYTSVGFPVHLPTGALITSVTLSHYNGNDSYPVSAGMYEIAAGGGESPVVLMTGSATGGNFVSENFPVDPPFVVSNTNAYVILSVVFPQQGITGFQVNYQLQVSPAPDTATFNDVPVGSPFFQFIEALAASGITAGCGGGNFCPDAPVTRGQIAVFLSKALGLYFPN